jgi:hypothetical protein
MTILLLMLFVQALPGPGTSAMSGTWKLNVAKSTYVGRQPHQAMTFKLSKEGQAVRLVRDGVGADGNVIRDEQISYYDGKERPYQGRRSADTYSARKLDDYTTVNTWKKDGKVMLVARSIVSEDGKSMVIVLTGTDLQGRAFRQVEIFEKQ